MALSYIQTNQALPPLPAKEQVYAPYASGPSSTNFSILAIAIIGILATAFLLVSYYIFVIKCCLNWHNFSHRFRAFRNLRSISDPQDHHHRHHQPMVYAPECRGLEEYVIQSIPVFHFKRKDCYLCEDSNDCAICLNQFEEGEKLRILPKCSHAFHIDCIDTWLQTHSNCPTCRATVSNTVHCHHYMIDIEYPFASTHQNLYPNGESGLSGDNGSRSEALEVGGAQAEQGTQSAVVKVGSTSSPKKVVESGFVEVKFTSRKSQALGKKMLHHQHHLSSVGDECIDVRNRDDQFSVEPIRRSFSMDSSTDRQLYISVAEILAQNPHLREVGSEEGCSTSSKARKTFFPFTHGRGISRNAILPVRAEPGIS